MHRQQPPPPPGDIECWWGVTTNCQGQEEAVPGSGSISSYSAVSEHSAFCALMQSVSSLTNAHMVQLLLAWAGRACWHHIAAARKETLQYPHVQWRGIRFRAASQPAALWELYWSRSLGPHGYLLIHTANHFLQSENHCYISQLQLLHTSQKLFSVEMAQSDLDSLHQVCPHAVLTGCWQQSEKEHIEKRTFFCRREIDHFPQVKNLHISPYICRIFISNTEERIKVFASSKQPPHGFKAF